MRCGLGGGMAVSGTVAIRVGGGAVMGDCRCRVCTLGDAGMRTGERSVRRGAGTECGTLGDATVGGCMAVTVGLRGGGVAGMGD